VDLTRASCTRSDIGQDGKSVSPHLCTPLRGRLPIHVSKAGVCKLLRSAIASWRPRHEILFWPLRPCPSLLRLAAFDVALHLLIDREHSELGTYAVQRRAKVFLDLFAKLRHDFSEIDLMPQ
jgi:hypothetical protein